MICISLIIFKIIQLCLTHYFASDIIVLFLYIYYVLFLYIYYVVFFIYFISIFLFNILWHMLLLVCKQKKNNQWVTHAETEQNIFDSLINILIG